jgi:hypothetical protein
MNSVQTEFGPYVPVSVRNREFLEDYPPSEGWGVSIRFTDLIDTKPGLKSLYIAAINSGRSFKSCGLPPLPPRQAIIVQAVLVKDGYSVDIASGDTYQFVEYEHDLEKAVTRARGRLLAALGYDPQGLDADEDFTEPTVAIQYSENTPEPEATPPVSAEPDSFEDAEPSAPLESDTETPDNVPSDIPSGLMQQVERKMARLQEAGVDVETPTNKTGALKILQTPIPDVSFDEVAEG